MCLLLPLIKTVNSDEVIGTKWSNERIVGISETTEQVSITSITEISGKVGLVFVGPV